MGMTELLLDSDLKPAQREWVSALRGGSQMLMSILRDILDLSKVDSGKLELEEQPYELISDLHETLGLFVAAARHKGLELRVDFGETERIWLKGDSFRVRQIFVVRCLTTAPTSLASWKRGCSQSTLKPTLRLQPG